MWMRATSYEQGKITFLPNIPNHMGISQPSWVPYSFVGRQNFQTSLDFYVTEKFTFIFYEPMLFWVLAKTPKFVSKPIKTCFFFFFFKATITIVPEEGLCVEEIVQGLHICSILLICYL